MTVFWAVIFKLKTILVQNIKCWCLQIKFCCTLANQSLWQTGDIWHSSLQPWRSLRFTKPTSSNTEELWPNREPWLAPYTEATPAQSSTVQPRARLTGEFQLNSISPLASVAAAWAASTQKAKFHIERENPLISWPLLPYEWTRKWNWEHTERHRSEWVSPGKMANF